MRFMVHESASLGERIRAARSARSLTQEQVARQLDVTQGAVAKWEADIAVPTLGNLRALALLLQVSAGDLLDAVGDVA